MQPGPGRSRQAIRAADTALKNRAAVLVATGIVTVVLAYFLLFLTHRSGPSALTPLIAVLGLATSTLGFVSFARHERRTRGLLPGMGDFAPRAQPPRLDNSKAACRQRTGCASERHFLSRRPDNRPGLN